ncbi:1-acyl-sn-glycerol-3-phosphate acyltransferase [Bacteriovorax sp. DB6_IX]|uniref:1-acyl-sn-glycerol-3-phosphate acyltransferase n=1 Tax=Bacteriovorax sp. DB6_IX TaxID=1353530 RepID=UPI00038A4F05|nr:1-acyl-sn-glycerol-3-phosphate acyltransferase [Bacteriovorax sp. DB6_IX]EQC43175.1 acyltransferase [Bacteriovorax sp. DB6_IX]
MLSKLQKTVLSYPKLKERIEKSSDSKGAKEKALKNLDEMKADFSKGYIGMMEKMLDGALPRLYDGINFNENGQNLKELMKENSLVLVPNHQSHADYVAINYKFYKTYKRPLFVAGGDNLNIFPIGKLFRKSGCFFIRRSFANDILYKFTMEAYLYALLMNKEPIEFFFEGGRTRSGKLRPPKFGLYQMLIEAHSHLPEDKKSPLLFVPISIAHEYVPEQRALAKEMMGGKKVKESTGQLLNLIKLVSYQFGNVHINVGKPVEAKKHDDPEINKKNLQELAFKCFRRVGKEMVVTPTSLLVLVLLDEAQGALKWSDIIAKANAIIQFCLKFEIPFVDSLNVNKIEDTLGRALDILIGNGKVEVIGRHDNSTVFYSIKKECRAELLFFKNTILHHFMIPWTINLAWINLFSGKLNSVDDFKTFFVEQRDQLKHEFYLPTVKEYFTKTLRILSDAADREIHSLEECLELSHQDLYKIASNLGMFSRTLSYINESYFVSALTLKAFEKEGIELFKRDDFMTKFEEVFNREIQVARVIRFPESYNVELTKNAIKYFTQKGFITNEKGSFRITDPEALNHYIQKLESELMEQLKFNLRIV